MPEDGTGRSSPDGSGVSEDDAPDAVWVAPRAGWFLGGVVLVLVGLLELSGWTEVACVVLGAAGLALFAGGYVLDARQHGIPEHDRLPDGNGHSSMEHGPLS